jgi:uncharacterized protein YjbI with pentapeptide repeats
LIIIHLLLGKNATRYIANPENEEIRKPRSCEEKAYITIPTSQKVVSWQTIMFSVVLMAALWLPVQADYEPVGAGEILAKVQMGQPVAYDHVRIAGDLNLSGLTVNSTFSITNSMLPGANFLGTGFAEFVDFEGTVFEGSADFAAAQFFKSTSFEDAQFHDSASFFLTQFFEDSSFSNVSFQNVSFIEASLSHTIFNQARFRGRADFNFTSFEGYCGFWNASLENASFLESQFKGSADFSNCSFGQVNFINAYFGEFANFECTSYRSPAIFAGANFQNLANFASSRFDDEASFLLTQFNAAAHFGSVDFQGDALFGLAKFEGLAQFEGSRFGGDLNLIGSQLHNVKLESVTLEKSTMIELRDAEFFRLEVPWKVLSGHLQYDGPAYIALVKNYRELEWFDDANDCYYRYRLTAQEQEPLGWTKIADIAAWISCGYGVRPAYTVLLSIAAIIFFALLFIFGRGIARADEKAVSDHGDTDFEESLYFSAMVFIAQAPVDFIPLGRYRYAVIFEGLLGWLLLALFLVSLGNIMIR